MGVCTHMRPSVTHKWIWAAAKDTAVTSKGEVSPSEAALLLSHRRLAHSNHNPRC